MAASSRRAPRACYQLVIKEPVGPVAAFTPWNFPINQVVRKVSARARRRLLDHRQGARRKRRRSLRRARSSAFVDAGVPGGRDQPRLRRTRRRSREYLIPHPVIRKVTFTGSTPVGKQLAALAGQHMKRVTMELGGHAPAIVFEDADVEQAAKMLAPAKFRNAGQVCVSPTRFLVHEKRLRRVRRAASPPTPRTLKVGNGLDADTKMGPLANRAPPRRDGGASSPTPMAKGAKLRTGGQRIGNKGYFFEPTVLTDVPLDARIMNEEPFGPLAAITPLQGLSTRWSRRPTACPSASPPTPSPASAKTADADRAPRVESGMVSINHHGLALPEVPFGGVKDSATAREGGSEAIEAYLNTKFVTQAGA